MTTDSKHNMTVIVEERDRNLSLVRIAQLKDAMAICETSMCEVLSLMITSTVILRQEESASQAET